ncbi:MAG: nickel pincer cofactor biosynthesis protein LarB [Planctomycetia bacterium]|nr:nickel pincer cofactor biosynthesis protein LarB [Planctomycetia bacterium]
MEKKNSKVNEKQTKSSDAHVDLDREHRCGYPEVIYAEGKTTDAIRRIILIQQEAGIDSFATRMSREKADDLLADFPNAEYNPAARTFWNRLNKKKKSKKGKVAIISAGTSDQPVAEEAMETARWMGAEVVLIQDVGVAGPARLHARTPDFKDADAIVVVAGMEGALPSVVGGYVAAPVIAVPTSVGYGAAFGGVAALLGMLNSCASNVMVVNIDAGFKGGYVAALIANRTHK